MSKHMVPTTTSNALFFMQTFESYPGPESCGKGCVLIECHHRLSVVELTQLEALLDT